VVNTSGEVLNYLGMHRDITEVHRLESQVRNQKALIESVVDAAPMVIALLDADDRVVLDNHEYKKLQADLGMAEPAPMLMSAVRASLEPDWDVAGARPATSFSIAKCGSILPVVAHRAGSRARAAACARTTPLPMPSSPVRGATTCCWWRRRSPACACSRKRFASPRCRR
jgi:hypothetical protein